MQHISAPIKLIKFRMIQNYSKNLTKSQLKKLIINSHSSGVFTDEDVSILLTQYELKGE